MYPSPHKTIANNKDESSALQLFGTAQGGGRRD